MLSSGSPSQCPAELEFKLGLPGSEACSLTTCHFLELIHEDVGRHLHSKATGQPEEEVILLATVHDFPTASAYSGDWAQDQAAFLAPWWAWLMALTVLVRLLDCYPPTQEGGSSLPTGAGIKVGCHCSLKLGAWVTEKRTGKEGSQEGRKK